ncbi:MAG TPA: metalloregulator ArsR/SmtB family transcription factor, partial [Dissulfurispiraceae bacterium]
IISALKDGEKTVTELVEILDTPKANVSQHLSVMRLKGILTSRRDGVNIYYSIANPKVVKACALMNEVLAELLMERSRIATLFSKP